MTIMGNRRRWSVERRTDAYAELEHPSDLFLEIFGRDPGDLAGNALFAFYDQIAELEEFDARREVTFEVTGPALDVTLRSLLAEALFLVDTEGFVATGGEVDARTPSGPDGAWCLSARLWGEDARRERHTLLHEVKAVTYHRLEAGLVAGSWKARVLLDL